VRNRADQLSWSGRPGDLDQEARLAVVDRAVLLAVRSPQNAEIFLFILPRGRSLEKSLRFDAAFAYGRAPPIARTKLKMEANPMARNGSGTKQASSRAKAKGKGTVRRPRRRSNKGPVNYKQMFALSKELRVRIYEIFCERIASPKEISEELNEGLSQVSYHVLILRECKLIVEDHKVPRRGAVEHFYRAITPTLIPPGAWDHFPPSIRRTISANILQTFFEDASASIEAEVFDSAPGELCWAPLILDALGIEEFGELSRKFLEAVLELQSTASQRLQEGNGNAVDPTTATVFLASFLSARSSKERKKASASLRR
jgi:DNA-binding transcriptional ArsR family regulator